MRVRSIEARVQAGLISIQTGLIVNALLAVVKILAGILGNSYALIADGIESTADIFSSLIVMRGLKLSSRAATEEYHFGFGKAESLSAALVALMLLTAAAAVAIAGAREIITPHHLPQSFTLVVLIVVVLVKEALFRFSNRISSDIDSQALRSDAWHHRSDALTSLAAFLGISIALWGGEGWEAADDYAAILAAGIIGFNGLYLLRDALANLMDRAPAQDVLQQISSSAASVPGVRKIEKLLVRRSGLGIFIEVHVHADPEMSLHDAHVLSGKVKAAIRESTPATIGAVIHMEPAEQEVLVG